MAEEEEHEVYNSEVFGDSKKEIASSPKSWPKGNMLKWMEISLSEPEKRTGTSMKMTETYTVYLVETKITDPDVEGYNDGPVSTWRRYSEFELLRNYLDITYPAVVVPPLPEKRVTYGWQKLTTDKFDPDFIERRRTGLENFILRVAAHHTLNQDSIFHSFLRQEEGWKEAVHSTGYQSKADSKLRALSASYRLKKPDKRFEELKSYSSDLNSHLHNVLKTRAKISDRQYGIHKVHGNYGRVFCEWSGIEKEMGDGLQSAGHFIDVYSSSIDSLLEDEEQFADQLKEYLGFCDALKSVCRKQELMQLDLEKSEDSLSSKHTQKEQLVQGKQSTFGGLKSKLFGSDTPEQKEQKLKQLDEQIDEAEELVRIRTEEAQKFIDEALVDIERFKRQKVKDIKEILINYAILQIERCKKGIAVWKSTRDCFEKM